MRTLAAKDFSIFSLAEKSCETMMKRKAEELPPKGRFHYHQGVFLLGMYEIYLLTKKEKYFEYIKAWVDSLIDKNGEILYMEKTELDDIQPGNLLFPLFEKTGDERYKKAMDMLINLLDNWEKTYDGGFWHKDSYAAKQMWLDGIYMAAPFMARYAKKFGRADLWAEVKKQTELMNEHLRDEKTGLFYHAWDSEKSVFWADKETGRSPEFWGRAMGWYTVAMLEIMETLPEESPDREFYAECERKIINSLVKYSDEKTGLWYQIVDKKDNPDNWPELSCTFLYIASIAKGIKMGVFDESYKKHIEKAVKTIKEMLEFEGDDLMVGDVVVGTGVEFYKYYVSQPKCKNDLHGVGAFLIMCGELVKLYGDKI